MTLWLKTAYLTSTVPSVIRITQSSFQTAVQKTEEMQHGLKTMPIPSLLRISTSRISVQTEKDASSVKVTRQRRILKMSSGTVFFQAQTKVCSAGLKIRTRYRPLTLLLRTPSSETFRQITGYSSSLRQQQVIRRPSAITSL